MTRFRDHLERLLVAALCAVTPAIGGTFQATLHAGRYDVVDVNPGQQRIVMDGYGALTDPGVPQLPTRMFLIAIPPGADIHQVRVTPAAGRVLPGHYRIIPAKVDLMGGEEGGVSREAVNTERRRAWQKSVDAIRASDDPFPAVVGEYCGDGTWRGYRYIKVRFVPFSYRPHSGELTYYPSCDVQVDYATPAAVALPQVRDTVMDAHLSRWITNFDDVKQWYRGDQVTSAAETFDYVIIAANTLVGQAVDTLVRWKEHIGFSVRVVTIDSILQQVSGRDDPERIWNFLKEKYPAQQWGIRYVLLVGDVDLLPIRFLFPSNLEWPYASDYYYAKLSGSWDVDGDDRWGEFQDDNLDPAADVLVGRIPHNQPSVIQTICQNIVAFEQDIGSWKRAVLHAAGFCDFEDGGTDEAVLAEYINDNTLQPAGWSYRTLYEKGGIQPSVYSCDEPLLEANYLQNLGPLHSGVVNLLAHGSPGGMAGQVWNRDIDGDGEIDPQTELGWNWYSLIDVIPARTSSVVFCCGCSTAPPCKTANTSVASSWTIPRTPLRNLCTTYLLNGAPVTIGSTAGSDYKGQWDHPNDGNGQSLNFYFFDELVRNDLRVGDAFYAAMLRYATNHRLQRGIRVFTLLGDPSLTLKGIDDRPGGTDVVVYNGPHFEAACDNSDGGDMYVVILTTNPVTATTGEVRLFRSTDHGQAWSAWQTVQLPHAVRDLDLVVAEFGTGEFVDNRLLLPITLSNRTVLLYRFPLDGGQPEVSTVASEDPGVYPGAVTITRGPEAHAFRLHLAYGVGSESAGSYAVRVARSMNNGVSWVDWDSFSDALFPDIDAGPNGRAYLALRKENADDDIAVHVSSDGGENWGGSHVLTDGDGATNHDLTDPVVAASTDPAFPIVWVAYPYEREDGDYDLRYSYSTNAGEDWTTDQILSGNAGHEGLLDIRSYRASPNRWVNAAYVPNLTPFVNQTVVWRWASGGSPGTWSPPRIVNDATSAAGMTPRILYSPGAPTTGSGVLYSDGQTVYFTAPWLPGGADRFGDRPENALALTTRLVGRRIEIQCSLSRLERARIILRDEMGCFYAQVADTMLTAGDHTIPYQLPGGERNAWRSRRLICNLTTATASLVSVVTEPRENVMAPASSGYPHVWIPGESIPGVFLTSSLARLGEGGSSIRFAGAIVSMDATRNEGWVFRSTGDSDQWERTDTLIGCSSVTSMLATSSGAILASGMRLYGNDAFGVIYRSEDDGDSWELVHEFPQGIVYDMTETDRGELYAASGWNGLVFRSTDGGESWAQASEIAPDITITSIVVFGDQVFIGTDAQRGGGVYVSPDQPMLTWTSTQGWSGLFLSVHDLVELNRRLYAAVGGAEGGGVYRSDTTGTLWAPSAPLPDTNVAGVRTLAVGSGGQIIAGAEMATGLPSALVFRSESEGEGWTVVGGELELAHAVYALMAEEEGKLFAGTGYTYGRIFRYDPTVSGIAQGDDRVPTSFSLAQNYPNPFNPVTSISYGLPRTCRIRLAVFDVLGRELDVLVEEEQLAGTYRVVWEPHLASGVYLYRIDAQPVGAEGKRFRDQKKMLLVR